LQLCFHSWYVATSGKLHPSTRVSEWLIADSEQAEEFHLNQTQLNLLSGVSILTQGYANIYIVPLSQILGRRFTSILFAVFIVLTTVWQALAESHGSLLVGPPFRLVRILLIVHLRQLAP
jgi:nitrate/nitrite transporter NarK